MVFQGIKHLSVEEEKQRNFCKSTSHNNKTCRKSQDKTKTVDDALYSYAFKVIEKDFYLPCNKTFLVDCGKIVVREIFVPKISLYNLRRNSTFERRQVHSVYHGTESLSFLGPKIWDLVPLELKQLESLEVFKLKIKKWIPFECPCRLCRTYIQQVGFV